ncbi:hypothetical protein E4P36_38055 [Streptomyces sp. 4R-3d]|nr:hypothetical protein E4P36_38055 [Streptomyces sp. 4R-3d]
MGSADVPVETGLADVVTLRRRRQARISLASGGFSKAATSLAGRARVVPAAGQRQGCPRSA